MTSQEALPIDPKIVNRMRDKKGKELYGYQVQAIDTILSRIQRFPEGYNLLYQLPTGGGKTVIFSELAKRYILETGKRVLILTHRIELLGQTSAMLTEIGVPNKIINSKVKDLEDGEDDDDRHRGNTFRGLLRDADGQRDALPQAADRAGPQRTQRRAEVGQVLHAFGLVGFPILVVLPGLSCLVAHARQSEPEDADGDDDAPYYKSEDSWDSEDERVDESNENSAKEPEAEDVPHAHHHVGVHLFGVVSVLGFRC